MLCTHPHPGPPGACWEEPLLNPTQLWSLTRPLADATELPLCPLGPVGKTKRRTVSLLLSNHRKAFQQEQNGREEADEWRQTDFKRIFCCNLPNSIKGLACPCAFFSLWHDLISLLLRYIFSPASIPESFIQSIFICIPLRWKEERGNAETRRRREGGPEGSKHKHLLSPLLLHQPHSVSET